MPEKGKDAVVVDQIKDETCKDTQLQKLSVRILTGDWEQHRKDTNIAPFYSVQNELYAVGGLLFRMNQIIIPSKPTEKSHQGCTPHGASGNNQNKAHDKSKVLVSNHQQYDRTDHRPVL